jgi:hypothetical protein
MTFRKEFLPPKKLIKRWESQYWEMGRKSGRFPCAFNEYLLMKSAEWGALKIYPVSRRGKKATGECPEVDVVERREQLTIFDFLAPSA